MDEMTLDYDNMELFRVFTEKRVEMVRSIMDMHIESIRALAEVLDRDIKNVWDDLHALKKVGVIEFRIHGRRKIPVVKKKRIVIVIR